MTESVKISNALNNLLCYIENENYRGYDPYDALKSPIFSLPFLRSNKILRFGTQQFVKRFPINLRPIIFVPKGYNPVTLGLCIQGYSNLIVSDPDNGKIYKGKIIHLVEELKNLIPEGFSGACWGYDFDWEARYSKIPAHQPSIVATGIITNALFIAYKSTGMKECRDLVISASEFVINDLNRSENADGICFSYSPFDDEQVFNASMKGVRLLVHSFNLTGKKELLSLSKSAANYVVCNQLNDGSWGYSKANTGGFTDNYHSGYVLDCLDEYQNLSGDNDYAKQLNKGYAYYIDNFISAEGAPKFYNNYLFPIDCTAAAQNILTTTRFGDSELAIRVANWMIDHMQKRNGSFKFRRFRFYTISTSFMRWSNSWMMVALSSLIGTTTSSSKSALSI